MATSYEKLQELDLTRDEVKRIGEAFKKEEFRKLFADYVAEIQDPENRKIYEQEITQLEKQRGCDVTFIHPKPGYVLKTSVNGHQKCFINICVNELVQKPSSSPAVKEGSRGLHWSLPHSISPAREDLDNKKVRCQVYDVVFHPDTLHLAERNVNFRKMVNDTALDAIETNFDVKLDRKNLKFPKLQYKGLPHACITRQTSKEKPEINYSPEEKEFFDKLYSNAGSPIDNKKSKKPKKLSAVDSSNYTTPKYIIKHRNKLDMEQFTEHRDAKLNAAIPSELIVEINLPLLKSSGDMTLDVTEKTVQLVSEKPSKYKLNLTLPYRVNESLGNAKFDKDLKKLVITLPVKRNKMFSECSVEDSGVESDHGSPGSIESEEDFSEKKVFSESQQSEQLVEKSTQFRTKFLDDNLCYVLPEFSCHVFENILAFTLNVKNVDENSVVKLFDSSSIHIKFTSISSSYYPSHYAFYVKLSNTIKNDEVSIETWDNNVIVQIPFVPVSDQLKSYFYGLSEVNLTEKCIEEPSIINQLLQEDKPLEIEMVKEENKKEVDKNQDKQEKCIKLQSRAIDITSCYESSGDELSCSSFSPSKSKGILKRRASQRSPVVRSISESSLDDFVSSSLENCHNSLDSVIPEDGEVSTSLKKTVRFNDNIMRQLFRSNASILGQKKKNQRKARNKKRASSRRHSESELSEVDEKQEGDARTTNEESDSDEKLKTQTEIFHLDMDN